MVRVLAQRIVACVLHNRRQRINVASMQQPPKPVRNHGDTITDPEPSMSASSDSANPNPTCNTFGPPNFSPVPISDRWRLARLLQQRKIRHRR